MTPSTQQQLIREFLRDLARLAVDELLEGAEGQNKAAPDEDLDFSPDAKGETGGNDSAHTSARAT